MSGKLPADRHTSGSVSRPVPNRDTVAVAIIGAGPYGLSLAAHLRSRGVEFRILGVPMEHWRTCMPKGMYLKSEASASNLFDPLGNYTLQRYFAENDLNYAPGSLPVALEPFTRYALNFQQNLVPDVDKKSVAAIEKTSDAFEVRLHTGEIFTARKVVVATGIAHSYYIPPVLCHLPRERLSHSSNHHDLSGFKSRHVTVIGGGQSALETAALLHELGVQVEVMVRRKSLLWNDTPVTGRRPLFQRLRRPMSNLGPGLGPWFYSNAPMLFCRLPQHIRIARARKTLGPAGAWWLRDRVIGRVPVMAGHSVVESRMSGDRVILHVKTEDSTSREVTTDCVIAATGYRFSAYALPFLRGGLVRELRCVDQKPVLSPNFESSVDGLYFIGFASAYQFGPAMRFLDGAGYTARSLASHLARRIHRLSSSASAFTHQKQVYEERRELQMRSKLHEDGTSSAPRMS